MVAFPLAASTLEDSAQVVHHRVNVNVNVNLYSALLYSASNALNAPNTAETSASSIGRRSWRS